MSTKILTGSPGSIFWALVEILHECREHIARQSPSLGPETGSGLWGPQPRRLWDRCRHRYRVTCTLLHSVRHAQLGKNGKLWQAYRSLCSFSLVRHQLEGVHAVRINDGATEFDTLGDYLAFVEARQRHAA